MENLSSLIKILYWSIERNKIPNIKDVAFPRFVKLKDSEEHALVFPETARTTYIQNLRGILLKNREEIGKITDAIVYTCIRLLDEYKNPEIRKSLIGIQRQIRAIKRMVVEEYEEFEFSWRKVLKNPFSHPTRNTYGSALHTLFLAIAGVKNISIVLKKDLESELKEENIIDCLERSIKKKHNRTEIAYLTEVVIEGSKRFLRENEGNPEIELLMKLIIDVGEDILEKIRREPDDNRFYSYAYEKLSVIKAKIAEVIKITKKHIKEILS